MQKESSRRRNENNDKLLNNYDYAGLQEEETAEKLPKIKTLEKYFEKGLKVETCENGC